MILEYKINHFDEAAKRFGDRIHGIFLTDDRGTQKNTFVSKDIFNEFFFNRYKRLFNAIHGYGWHGILHSCGRVNDFVPLFLDIGVDVLNMQQPQAYGIRELGDSFAGKVCFLTTVDIQATLPKEDPEAVRAEARELVENWSTPDGGFIFLMTAPLFTSIVSDKGLGKQKVLVIMVKFPDVQPSFSREKMREKYFGKLDRYLQVISYKKTLIEGKMTDWYLLPHNVGHYHLSQHNLEVEKNRVTKLIDADPSIPQLKGAPFTCDGNRSFNDEKHNISIKLVSQNRESFKIFVSNSG